MTNEYKISNNYLPSKNIGNYYSSKLDYWERQAQYERLLKDVLEQQRRDRSALEKDAAARSTAAKLGSVAATEKVPEPEIAKAYASTLSKRSQRLLREPSRAQLRNRFGTSFMSGSLLAVALDFTVVPSTVPAGHSVADFAYWCVTLAPLVLGGTLPLVHEHLRTRPKLRARRAAILSKEEAKLRDWLQARYGLALAPEESGALTKTIATYKLTSTHLIYFTALDGVEYACCYTTEGTWLVLGPSLRQQNLTGNQPQPAPKVVAKPEQAMLEAAPAPISTPAPFDGEVALLHKRLTELTSLLGEQELGVEQQHVVNRVQQDAEALASTLARLAKLGDSQAGQQRAAAVMGQLVEELNELLTGEKANLLRELDVQETYVRERRTPASSGRLVLPAPAADTMREVAHEH